MPNTPALDIVENIDNVLAASDTTAAVRSCLTAARDEIVRLRQAQAMLEFVFENGLPMCRNNQHRYHGVSEPIWHNSREVAVQAAMWDFAIQHPAGDRKGGE